MADKDNKILKIVRERALPDIKKGLFYSEI